MLRSLQSVAIAIALLGFAVASRAESGCWTDELEAPQLDPSSGPITFDFEEGVGLWARPSLVEPVPRPARLLPDDLPSDLPDGEWSVELPPEGLAYPIDLHRASRVEFRFVGDVDEFICCPDIRSFDILDTYYYPTPHYRLLDLDRDDPHAGVASLDLQNLPPADECGSLYSCVPWDRCGWFLIQAQKDGRPTWAVIDDVTIHPAPEPDPSTLAIAIPLVLLGLRRWNRPGLHTRRPPLARIALGVLAALSCAPPALADLV